MVVLRLDPEEIGPNQMLNAGSVQAKWFHRLAVRYNL
jgi:hypothetical protein